MRTIKELLNIVITLEDNPQTSKVIDFHKGVPTPESDVYRRTSPILKVRYELFGKWLNATHGDWLDTEEMGSFWNEGTDDEWLADIVRGIRASMGNQENHATGLFAFNRVSVFAASDNSYEMICLAWFDDMGEPELWVYDCSGKSRYRDLVSYLQTYIDDNASVSVARWKLAGM